MESLTKPVTENGDCTARRALRGTVGLLKKAHSVILSAAKNLRDADFARLGRPFTSFRVTYVGFLNSPTVPSFPDVDRVLDEIRAGAENVLYGAGPEKSEELFAKHVVSLIEGAGLPVLQTMHYRWFLRELARLWRTRTGRDLAFHLELCIRKWVGLGLEPRTLQFLVTEAHERLKGKELTTKTQRHEDPSPNSSPAPRPSSLAPDFALPGIMSGPRPPADSATGPLESSNPGVLS